MYTLYSRTVYDTSRRTIHVVWPQQVDLWVRVRGTPFPHIHTYILQDEAGPWCTQLQILDLPVLELDPLNNHLFFLISTSQKGAFHQIVKKSQNLLHKKTYFCF